MNLSTVSAAEFLLQRAKVPKPFSLTVSGVSMLPVLRGGDIISVCRKNVYEIGDILVFIYKQGEVLVHRLLKIEKGRYYLKGDNSFRLEDILEEQIVGAVLLKDDPHKTEEFVKDSYQINRVYRGCKYDLELTKQSSEYQCYREKYLEG